MTNLELLEIVEKKKLRDLWVALRMTVTLPVTQDSHGMGVNVTIHHVTGTGKKVNRSGQDGNHNN